MLTEEQRKEIEREARENAISFALGAAAMLLTLPLMYVIVMMLRS
jgi:hypothetical protein